MLKRFLTGAAIAFAASLCVAGVSRAAVVDFNSHTTQTSMANGFSEGGLDFAGYSFWFIPPDVQLQNPSTFPTPIETPVMATWVEPMVVTLTGGGAFDLTSVSTGLGWYNLSGEAGFTDSETITGHKADCLPTDMSPACLVTTSFDVGYTFQDHALTGFTGLDFVTFGTMTPQHTTDDNGQPFTYSGFIGYDNITYAAAAAGGAVPEPAAWALMIVGFGGVGAMIRRSRRAATLAAAAAA